MKPFSLSHAIAGDPVILMQARNNEPLPVRFIGEMSDKRIVVEWQDCYEAWHLLSCWATELRMVPKKRTVYTNLYASAIPYTDDGSYRAAHFPTKDAAEHNARFNDWRVLAVAVPVEIENED